MEMGTQYKFPVSLSIEAFWNKEESGSMIGTGKDENNKEIRKHYGWNPDRGVSYKRIEVTAQQLYKELLHGKVFCHLFNPTRTRKDGTFGMSEKTNQNFEGSYVIGVDIDKTKYPSITEYISTLTLKPTFYYTTYSNQQLGKGLRFRMIYVFKEKIQTPLEFRYTAKLLNDIIERDTKEAIEDDCNLRCSQYFNGTNVKNSSIISSYDYTGAIYSLEDIGYSKEDLTQYLTKGAGYKTQTRTRKDEINKYLLDLGYTTTTQQDFIPEIREDQELRISRKLIEDMKTLPYDEFMKYNRHKYKYSYRSESGEWVNGIYQQTKEGDFTLYYNVNKVKDGEKRRKKLFERICLRRIQNPDIDPDTLLFCAYEDRQRFFEIDKDLDIDCLVNNVEAALDLELQEIETMYSKNLQYLRDRKKPGSFIFKPGEYTSKGDLKAVTWNIISENYNPEIGLKENYQNISKMINISERTLRRYCKEHNIEPNKAKLSDEQVIDLIDLNLSGNENFKRIREMGYMLDRARLLRIYRELKRE